MKKILYIPRVLSTTGLLLLLNFVTLPRFFPVKNETVIKHNLPAEDRNSLFSGYWLVTQKLKKKKIIHIDFTGDIAEDDKKISFIQSEARRLKYMHDTSKVIEIYLSDEITYSRFVQLINVMLTDKHKMYGLWKNCFYIFGEAPPRPIQPETTHPLYM